MPLAPPVASVQGSHPASRQTATETDQLSARTLLECAGFRGQAAPVEHPPAVGLLSAHTPQRDPSVAAVSFIGGSGAHDVGELSPQVAIDRVMVESAAGDEHCQQIRFRCDTGRSGRCSRAGTRPSRVAARRTQRRRTSGVRSASCAWLPLGRQIAVAAGLPALQSLGPLATLELAGLVVRRRWRIALK
jgi:hypothetical protein